MPQRVLDGEDLNSVANLQNEWRRKGIILQMYQGNLTRYLIAFCILFLIQREIIVKVIEQDVEMLTRQWNIWLNISQHFIKK